MTLLLAAKLSAVEEPLTVQVVPWGPTAADIENAKSSLLRQPVVQRHIWNSRHRILSFELLDAANGGVSSPPDGYRATIFNYTRNKAILVEGRFDRPDVQVSLSERQPLPSPEEFEAALTILSKDPHFGSAIRSGTLRPYRSMPPLVSPSLPVSRIERTLTVGLLPQAGLSRKDPPEIVGVNMIRGTVVRFPTGAPPTSYASETFCGLPSAGQQTSSRGDAGQYQFTVKQGSTVIWSFLAIRPSVSSGTNGSGIELRDIQYRGKRVLARAHLPILNILYIDSACGPYRDWQWQESMINATGSDLAPGIRLCTSKPQTILEDNNDTGDFLGVGVYIKGQSLYLISEMEAGWYRYVSQWQFDTDGSIHPRFGFGAVQNSCVCHPHVHHAYWRLDFDIDSAGSETASEEASSGTTLFTTETERRRPPVGDPRSSKTWLVQNPNTGDAYRILPGPNDGSADGFGKGDLWFLQYHSNEMDDGIDFGCNPSCSANLDPFVNGESIQNQEVVLWYGIHFVHDFSHPGHQFYFGPDLVPVSW